MRVYRIGVGLKRCHKIFRQQLRSLFVFGVGRSEAADLKSIASHHSEQSAVSDRDMRKVVNVLAMLAVVVRQTD